MNSLERLIEIYPEITSHSWIELNPNITVRMKDLASTWECLSDNPALTIEIIRTFETYYRRRSISICNNITWYDIRDNLDLPWVWYDIMDKPHITLRTIRDNPHLPWDIRGLSRNPNITWKYICNNPQLEWHYVYLSGNKAITMDIIENNMHLPWYWPHVSENPNVTVEFVKRHMDQDWDWNRLSRTIRVCDNLDLPWDWFAIKIKSWQVVRDNINVPWDWYQMSLSDFITIDIVAKYPFLPWDWIAISGHPNITWNDICNNPQLPWRESGVSKNPNITWKIIRDNPDYGWKLEKFGYNKFYFHPHFQSDYYRKKNNKMLIDIIGEELIKVSCHPRRILQTTYIDSDHPLYGFADSLADAAALPLVY